MNNNVGLSDVHIHPSTQNLQTADSHWLYIPLTRSAYRPMTRRLLVAARPTARPPPPVVHNVK